MKTNTLSFSTVDVFTRERFSGNPVAVIHDARDLDPSQMQAIAREFGYSETTFILPPRDAGSIAQVRIFTPHAEVPFAGHPNIGTVFVMAHEDTAARGPLPDVAVLDELGGPVRIWPLREAQQFIGAQIEAPQPLQTVGEVDPNVIARCLGLDLADIVSDKFPPCVASVGLPFAFAELRNLDALAAIETDAAAFRGAAQTGPETVDGFAVCAFVVTQQTGSTTAIRSRVFSPLGHPPEDPATGSASGALAALLSCAQDQDTGLFTITQGVEMGRRSEIDVEINGQDRQPRIRGHCVMVSRGTMSV
ncbi:PhzF family phenazine biosynthesis protein [Roseobacter weihaiensis]|uniref:PhzF family phenazine biosynthesis protein n=1 Tax=Roseobacter weihaiensis TaxID=2763262 RepID=UPI001D0A0515|nr:PhzF family phenazine biosynthesis protein [Roseobacter sp. H9]